MNNRGRRQRQLNRLLVGKDKVLYMRPVADNNDKIRTLDEGTAPASTGNTTPMSTESHRPPRIQMKSINLNVEKNALNHHTDKFAIVQQQTADADRRATQRLVIRRTQPFRITLGFDRKFDREKHDLKLLLRIGDKPQAGKGTAVIIPVFDRKGRKKWHAHVAKLSDTTLELEITLPVKCIIGIWDLSVLLITDKVHSNDRVLGYNFQKCLYVLLNPWSQGDTVYMGETKMLDEYVLNDAGILFLGNEDQITGKAWNFAQFEEDILDICLAFVRKAFGWKVNSKMADPVKLSRAIAQIVNHFDDGGIMVGNWSRSFPGGMRPQFWSGSESILKRYVKTRKPVKYGQCWVFAALTTTICRAIGLPVRPVTNYMSAHDTDGSLTIDALLHRDPITNEIFTIPNESKDSIWIYHIWNDVWMARPDLEGYGGWQAIDATPQERSDGLMCCGPTPLRAIKNGESVVPYDTAFLFAEVNADRVWWETTDNVNYQVNRIDKRSVGRRIITKSRDNITDLSSVPLTDRYRLMVDDITEEYKHAEGSKEENRAVKSASQISKYVRTINRDTKRDELRDIEIYIIPTKDVMIGSDFDVKFSVKNVGLRKVTVTVTVMVEAVSYTGRTLGLIGKQRYDSIKLRKRHAESWEFHVSSESYLANTDEQAAARIHVSTVNTETNEITKEQANVQLVTPDLDVKLPTDGRIGETVDIEVSFINPLSVPLTNCSVILEGSSDVQEMQLSNIGARDSWAQTFSFKPKTFGNKQIVVSMDCDELPHLSGFASMTVTK